MNRDDDHRVNEDGIEQGRREFLKGSVAAAGAGLAAATVPGVSAAATESDSGTDEKGYTRLKNVVARPDLWFYPGEELDPDEMRITLMGTGWCNIIRHEEKGASISVKDLGTLVWDPKAGAYRPGRPPQG